MARPRRWTAIVAVLCGLVLLRVAPAGAQEVSSTTTSTARERLTTTSVEPSEGDGGDDGLSTGNKVVFLIIGLVVLALVLIVFTWRYWRATRPPPTSVAAGRSTPPV